jgi:serine/threonine-protein kinase ATR
MVKTDILLRHSVVAFVRPNLQPDVRRANFVVVLEWLRNLSEKDDMPLQEACILTLCRLARYVTQHQVLSHVHSAHHVNNRVSEDDEKNIILLRLLEYLGHPNPYVCAVTYNEVSNVHLIMPLAHWDCLHLLAQSLLLVITCTN